MFKFKVGDRVVRARHSTNISNCPIGYQTVVTGLLGEDKPYGIWYNASDGRRQNSTSLQDWDLVESIESPIRTVTRREPVEGKYGIVQVDVHNGQIVISISPEDGHQPTGGQLRSAAMVISQIAEFRDGVEYQAQE